MTWRWLWLLTCLPLVGCHVYDSDLLARNRGGSGGSPKAGTSGEDGGQDACVPSPEVCNDRDDDCNGVIDDEEPSNQDCSDRYHAHVTCGRDGICLFVASSSMCYPGYYHCDGQPDNGCESTTPCCPPACADGEDAGAPDPDDEDAG